MDVTNKIQAKLTKILKKLKSLGIIETFVLEMTFCQVEESVKKSLIEIDAVLKKCLRKIISKPRKAEIRNIITELVRKKNLNDILITKEPVENTTLVTKTEEIESNQTDDLKFQCDICEGTFDSEQNLITHKEKHNKIDKYLCEKCGKQFYSIQRLLSHQGGLEKIVEIPEGKENLNETITSEIIQDNDDFELLPDLQLDDKVTFESGKLLKRVRKSKSSNQKNKVGNQVAKKVGEKFICGCGKMFRVLKTLRKHERIKHSVTNIQHKCIICGKCFIEKGKLNRHILSHNDYKYCCSFCLKQFSRSDTLKRHISIFHFNSKKFNCNFCQKKFSLKYNRDIHEQNIHKDVNNRVQCDYCGNKFKNKITLKSHLRTHFENRVTCTACRKSFTKMKYLEIHVKNKHFDITPRTLDSATS